MVQGRPIHNQKCEKQPGVSGVKCIGAETLSCLVSNKFITKRQPCVCNGYAQPQIVSHRCYTESFGFLTFPVSKSALSWLLWNHLSVWESKWWKSWCIPEGASPLLFQIRKLRSPRDLQFMAQSSLGWGERNSHNTSSSICIEQSTKSSQQEELISGAYFGSRKRPSLCCVMGKLGATVGNWRQQWRERSWNEKDVWKGAK